LRSQPQGIPLGIGWDAEYLFRTGHAAISDPYHYFLLNLQNSNADRVIVKRPMMVYVIKRRVYAKIFMAGHRWLVFPDGRLRPTGYRVNADAHGTGGGA
jgi:hypothetical protein